ncbi:MAG: hypothetical protein LBH43_09995 [Treponema sp.]|jgi:hypothetical protein|nr:hypothetical protein [Treponema sp.]
MNILFDKAEVSQMSPITQKIDVLLKAESYSLLECGRKENKPAPTGTSFTVTAKTVNRLEYMREGGERVFVITHEVTA